MPEPDVAVASMEDNLATFLGALLRDDHDLVATSIRMNPFALKLASNRLRSDTSLAIDAVKLLPQVKEYVMRFAAEAADPSLLGNTEFMLFLVNVNVNGLALRLASSGLRRNRDICLAAIRNDAVAIKWADALVTPDPDSISSPLQVPAVNAELVLECAFQTNPGVRSLCVQLLPMYRSGFCTDVEVDLSDGGILHAHKLVLCARSPVFKALFSSGMRDAHDSRYAGSGTVKD